MNESGEVLWALTDNQGSSVRMVLDNDGNVVNEIIYDAFGNITVESNPDVNFRFSYTGRELNSETGLIYYRTRLNDPKTGRFISEDTIGFAGGDSNLYRYVVNNPVNYTDPYGEDLYDVLNTADKFAAGFADTVTLGLSTKFRESAYGDLATRNHEGGVFNVGQVVGAGTMLLAGFNTPGNFAAGLSWAQKAAIGYEVAATGYGAYDATSKFLEGCATPLDALNFLPAAGYGFNRLRGLNNVDDAARGLDDFADFASGGRFGDDLPLTSSAHLETYSRYIEYPQEAYKAIRNSGDDISSIARNTGWSEGRIKRIKEHLFVKKHQLDDRLDVFDPDPDIADAWGRLQKGDHKSSDIDLLKHEYFESKFEGIFKTDYRTAHDATIQSGRTWNPEN